VVGAAPAFAFGTPCIDTEPRISSAAIAGGIRNHFGVDFMRVITLHRAKARQMPTVRPPHLVARGPDEPTRRREARQRVVAAYDTRYGAPAMSRTPFDELVHRVNNLLGTIEVQAEVARTDGSLAAHTTALQQILDSARRTQDDVRRLRQRSEPSDR
jgi:hypothetical protein